MGTSIELWQSTTGTAPAGFSLLTTVAETAPALPGGPTYSYPETPVIPGFLYTFKQRRFDPALNAYSDFTAPVTVRAPWPLTGEVIPKDPNMSTTIVNTNTGLRTRLGFGLEAVEGVPVKPTILLDRISGNPDIDLEQLQRKALRNTTSVVGGRAGKATVSGKYSVEPTPQALATLLCALYGTPSLTAVAAVVGPPAVPTYNRLIWSDTLDQFTGTFTDLRGGSVYAHPGARLDGFSVKADADQSEIITAECDITALDELLFDSTTTVGLDTAGVDILDPYSPIDAAVSIAGQVSADAKSFDVALKRNLKLKRVLRGKRGAASQYLGRSANTASTSLFFSTEAEIKRFFGVPQNQGYPYGAGGQILYLPVSLVFTPPVGPAGFPYTWIVRFPNASYAKRGEQINGEDAIMQAIEIMPYLDPATNTNVQIELWTTQALADVTTPGTAINITGLHNGVQVYNGS